MKLIINPIIKCVFCFLPFFAVPSSNAASDSTVINLSYTFASYVSLTGTAPGASRFYDNNDLVNLSSALSVNIGTMGLESNVGGICDMEFSTVNDFKLIHTLNGNSLGGYIIQYEGEVFSEVSSPILQLPCTSSATDINFKLNSASLVGFDFFLASGIYQDIINVEVTTQ